MQGNMGDMMQAVQDMKEKMKDLNVTVSSEDELVKVVMNGHQQVKEVVISPEVFNKQDAALLSAVITETFERALYESKKMMQEEVKKQSEEMGIPIPTMPGMF